MILFLHSRRSFKIVVIELIKYLTRINSIKGRRILLGWRYYRCHCNPSIVCWKRDGRDSQNIEKLVSELVRCKPKWQNEQGIWRRDHVWVREHADAIEEEAGQPRRNNLIGRLLAIVTVHDPE